LNRRCWHLLFLLFCFYVEVCGPALDFSQWKRQYLLNGFM